ncbi:MAG: hypothetical protein HZB41_01590 [Ignavibacteriae bacterium]|nr:hypothetical protein [Ignavibacteriota bacterium]
MKSNISFKSKYKPSKPCSCDICNAFCMRPGWWTVEEAMKAIDAGYAKRMMLEMAPEMTFGVLSPAFKGCEGNFALNTFSKNGCNFFVNNLCELHGTGLQPLECRVSHHDRTGMGIKCHADLEKDWNSQSGQSLIMKWGNLIGFWIRYQNLH